SRAHNVTIEDVAIRGAAVNGISTSTLVLSPNIVTVRRCRVLGDILDRLPGQTPTAMTLAGIDVRFALAPLVEDCVVANIAGDGIRILTANSGDTTSSGIIRGCVVSRCGGNGPDLDSNSSS